MSNHLSEPKSPAQEAIEALAKLMYERIEVLDPGGPNDCGDWDQLSNREKYVYWQAMSHSLHLGGDLIATALSEEDNVPHFVL